MVLHLLTFFLRFLHIAEQMTIFVLNVSMFISHLALNQQVPQVSLLQKPPIEPFEYFFVTSDVFCFVGCGVKQFGQMAWSSYKLYLFEVKQLTLLIVTLVFPNKFINLFFVVGTDKLPDNLLSYIPTDIFIVVTFTPHFLLFNFFEYVQPSIISSVSFFWFGQLDCRFVSVQDHVVDEIGWNKIKNERSLWSLGGVREQSAKKGVVGLAVVQTEEHGLLILIHGIGIMDIDVV